MLTSTTVSGPHTRVVPPGRPQPLNGTSRSLSVALSAGSLHQRPVGRWSPYGRPERLVRTDNRWRCAGPPGMCAPMCRMP
jgi:hypothetical protein